MNGSAPTALTRRRRDGTLYQRRPEIEAALASLLGQTREEVAAALQVRDRKATNYIASECLVHLIRQTRQDNHPAHFERLFKELMRRLQAALPRFTGERINESENAHAAEARDRVRDAIIEKILKDRLEPGPGLDYFEVMFNGAVAALRINAAAKAQTANARQRPIEFDGHSNEPSAEVERALANFNLKDELLSDDPIYRNRVYGAIEGLPDKQRQVISLMIKGFPLDSDVPGAVSIRSIIGVKSEKTVRNRRNAALEAIRKALKIGNGDD